jgi:virginiamycin B lyase
MAVAPPAGAQVGTVTEIPLGSGSDPYGIAAGGDGDLWFTTLSAGYIGRVTPAGTPTQFSAGISAGSPLRGIVAGPDSNLWYVDDTGKIGRITPDRDGDGVLLASRSEPTSQAAIKLRTPRGRL